MDDEIQPIAIHLPQFHPIPENDAWWGKGFTEWTNVTKARPRFKGHYQPHLPADLGFYDLRLEEARLAQESLAKEYGIYGFCYYHYWFNGKRLLYEPIDRKLKNPKEDFPFMLCWANENWTRVWDGRDKQVLLHQEYSKADDLAHIRFLCEHFFSDDRYIKLNGKAVFSIYRPLLFPNIQKTLEAWRSEALRLGIGELYLGYAQSMYCFEEPESLGFDFAFAFPPHVASSSLKDKPSFSKKVVSKLKNIKNQLLNYSAVEYGTIVEAYVDSGFQKNVYPSVVPQWDNTSRRNVNPSIVVGATPELYQDWLTYIVENCPWDTLEGKFLFINAWNEWAEGNHLEPCQKWGRAYLEATKNVLGQ
jgi:hypothetical protein